MFADISFIVAKLESYFKTFYTAMCFFLHMSDANMCGSHIAHCNRAVSAHRIISI